MADITVTGARRDEAPALSEEPATAGVARAMPALSRPLAVLWAGIVVAIAAFLAFGSVRIGAGNWAGLRMPVREIWTRFIDFLVGEGASPTLVILVTAAAAVTLAGAAGALWLAFSLKDAPSVSLPEDAAGL
ncbi:MAG: hypothetical protein ACRDJC_02600 [Thermomicrobiales bacterium]